jgi:16S rRNA (cytosine967-C5)-methyltransferase
VAPSRRPTTARGIALEVIRRVADEGAYSNRLLPALLSRFPLDERERDLATELAYGTLRRVIPLDFALGPLLARPLKAASPVARAALRLGAYQLLFTRIPPHAAVGETVGLVGGRDQGFVNAVLRRLSNAVVPWPEGADDDAVSIRTGLAPWAVRELRLLLPPEEVEPAAEALASQAPLTLRPNPCRAPEGEPERSLLELGLTPEAGSVHPSSLRLRGGAPAQLPGFREGWFAVQDEASSWVVDLLEPQRGERVLDACAGPGGKAADIACRAGEVVAADVAEGRVRLVGETARRLGVRVRLLLQDAARPALRPGFDRVLVDAPCSGIGTARRRPELLWRVERRHLSTLARLQVRLLAGTASLLRPGGVLVYSVCTFPRAETEAVCRAVQSKVPTLEPDPIRPPEGGPAGPSARLWPHRDGTDAMFVARWVAGG